MKYLLYTFILIALYHLVYEGILLPSLRLRLRYYLFELRDRVRNLKNINNDCCSDQAFSYIQDTINNGLTMLHRTDLIMLMSIESHVENNEILKKQINRRTEVLSKVEDNEVKSVMRSISHVGRAAVLLNSGGWFIYVIPALLTIATFGRIKGLVKELLVFPDSHMSDGGITRQHA